MILSIITLQTVDFEGQSDPPRGRRPLHTSQNPSRARNAPPRPPIMDGKENHAESGVTQRAPRNETTGLAQRSQNQLNQHRTQRRGRAGKARQGGTGRHNNQRHGPWQAASQRQWGWPRSSGTHPQGLHWFPAPGTNAAAFATQQHQAMQPQRFPMQHPPATPSYPAQNSMRYVYATPGTQLATEISAMVRHVSPY